MSLEEIRRELQEIFGKLVLESKYPKRFFKDRFYIGVKTLSREPPRQEWVHTLSIRKFKGKPYNKYEYEVITEYDERLWNELLDEIRNEAKLKNKDVEITEDYAYTVPKWVHIPRADEHRSINLRPLLMQIKEEYGILVDNDYEKLIKYKGEKVKVVRWESPGAAFHLHYRCSDIPTLAIASFDTFEKGGIYRLHIRETIPYQRGKIYNYKYDSEDKFYSSLNKQVRKRLDLMRG